MNATLEAAESAAEPSVEDSPINIFDKAIALALELGKFGTGRKLGTDKIEVDGNKDRYRASKRILDSQELSRISQAQAALGSRMRQISLPSLFKSGVYLIPKAMLSQVDAEVAEAQTYIMNTLVPAFMAVYPALIEADKAALASNWNSADYPSPSKVRESFYVEWNYVNLGTPESLQSVDPEVYIREQEKAQQKMAQVSEEITQVMRSQMLDLVDHLASVLGGDKDGKKKTFKATTVTNVKEFLSTFKARNIVDDRQLDVLVSQAGQLLDGVDPQTLRDQDVVRDRVRVGFEAIKTQLDTMVVAKPSRMIRFEQAEEKAVEEYAAAQTTDEGFPLNPALTASPDLDIPF